MAAPAYGRRPPKMSATERTADRPGIRPGLSGPRSRPGEGRIRTSAASSGIPDARDAQSERAGRRVSGVGMVTRRARCPFRGFHRPGFREISTGRVFGTDLAYEAKARSSMDTQSPTGPRTWLGQAVLEALGESRTGATAIELSGQMFVPVEQVEQALRDLSAQEVVPARHLRRPWHGPGRQGL